MFYLLCSPERLTVILVKHILLITFCIDVFLYLIRNQMEVLLKLVHLVIVIGLWLMFLQITISSTKSNASLFDRFGLVLFTAVMTATYIVLWV